MKISPYIENLIEKAAGLIVNSQTKEDVNI